MVRRHRLRAALRRAILLAGLLAAAGGLGCGGSGESAVQPTRGCLLVSVAGLRGDRLGAWGGDEPADPFLGRAAARGALFVHAVTPHAAPLVAETSLLTGLLPAEHGVLAPNLRPSRHLVTLPERLAERGLRTAGFTTGAWATPEAGFDRGFDAFSSLAALPARAAAAAAVDETLAFLGALDGGERFFVYLQLELVGPVEVAGDAAAAAAYDAAVARLDAQLGRLEDGLERLGLEDDATWVLTASHGYELGEHGRFGHGQVYPETIGVPLLVLHPGLEGGRRLGQLVQTVDVAPTVHALAGLGRWQEGSGMSLVPLLDATAAGDGGWAVAESAGMRPQRTWIVQEGGRLEQLVSTTYRAETDGTWMSRSATFDADEHDLVLEMVSFRQPRTVEVLLDGRSAGSWEVPTRWRKVELPPPPAGGPRRITLAAGECEVPARLGLGADPRCLSIKVRGPKLSRLELFDLERDPGATTDVGDERPERRRRLAERLESFARAPRARPERRRADPEAIARFQAGEEP